MFVDALILLPVTVFLLWLYAYCGPRKLRGRAWLADRWPAFAAIAASIVTLFGLHLAMDGVYSIHRSAWAVSAAYMGLVIVLGYGWMLSALRRREWPVSLQRR